MSKDNDEKVKRENLLFKEALRSCFTNHQLMSHDWPVNTLFQKAVKSVFFQTQLEASQGHPSSLAKI